MKSCQEYLRTLSETIKPETLSHPSINTSIAIIGCGDPGLIDHYSNETGCPFPIFSDPTRKLFDEIGLTTSYAWGSHPEYIRKSMFQIVTGSIMQGLKQVSSGLATKGGNTTQIGGEFLFESTTSGSGEGKEITWCHRMKNTRDHTEISELVRVLGLDGLGQPLKE
jgi:hypothetical protein